MTSTKVSTIEQIAAAHARSNQTAQVLSFLTGIPAYQIVELAAWHAKYGVDKDFGFQLLKYGREAKI